MQNFETCQIFTPSEVVNFMIDISIDKNRLFNIKILENSAGQGSFLLKIVELLIIQANKVGINTNQLASILETNIYGFEIDDKHHSICIDKLNELTSRNGLRSIDWKIFMQDSLQFDSDIKFDLVIGNPPYIKYSGLCDENRAFIKKKYKSCEAGKPDYYYAFIEDGITRLSDSGRLVYLIPSNLFKNTHARLLREYIKPNLTDIFDYKQNRIFKRENSDVSYRSVTSSIIIVDKRSSPQVIHYTDLYKKKRSLIQKDALGNNWFFGKNNTGDHRFGDCYNVQISTATQLNEAFVIKQYVRELDYYVVDGNRLENRFIHNAAKPNSLKRNLNEVIIFPYLIDENGSLSRIDDLSCFPGIHNHLIKFKDALIKRKSDESAKWYEYGRSQAVNSVIGNRKLLFSTVITHKVQSYIIDEDTIPYSGIYVTECNDQFSLEQAKRIIESKRFYKYALNIGILVDGNSIRVKVKDIKDYRF